MRSIEDLINEVRGWTAQDGGLTAAACDVLCTITRLQNSTTKEVQEFLDDPIPGTLGIELEAGDIILASR